MPSGKSWFLLYICVCRIKPQLFDGASFPQLCMFSHIEFRLFYLYFYDTAQDADFRSPAVHLILSKCLLLEVNIQLTGFNSANQTSLQ